MRRKKKPRSPSPPPKVYPGLLCVGGPRDGEILSRLDLPMEAFIGIRDPARPRVKTGAYVRQQRSAGDDVWQWKEIENVD